MKVILTAIAMLIAGPASAADMPTKASNPTNAYAAASTPMWSGFYFGGDVGWTAGTVKVGTGSADGNGMVWGGHFGFQKQAGWIVGGIEADFTKYDQVKINGAGCDCYVVDLLGKVGVTITPNLLAYVVGGGFYHNANQFLAVVPQFGWTVGAGLDWLPINDHWVIGFRYQYRDLENNGTLHKLLPITVSAHEFKIPLSYKF